MSEPCDTLKKFEPSKLKATLADGTEVPIAVPRIRNRWSRVQQTLDSLRWVRIEALDKSGSVLGVVEDEETEEVEDDDGMEGEHSDIRMAKVLLEVQRATMKETRLMFEVQMRGQAELVEALIAGVKSISQSYEMSMGVQRAALIAETGEKAGGSPEIMAMLQLAMSQMAQSSAPKLKP